MEKMILGKDWEMRGWADIPCAVRNIRTHRIQPVSREMMSVLIMCSGDIKIDVDEKDKELYDEFRKLRDTGILVQTEEGMHLRPEQKYRRYPCVYYPSVQWSVTGKCNYHCRHCCISAPEAAMGEVTSEQCLDIIGQLSKCGIDTVRLTGGEPLVRKDFWRIADELRRRNMDISMIYSNGSLMDGDFFSELDSREMKPAFQLSFDGVGCHDWLRGVDGAEEKTVRAIRECVERGYQVSCAMALHKLNVSSVRETVKTLGALGVKELKINPAHLSGDWKKYPQYSIGTEEAFRIYLDYLPEYYEDGRPLSLMLGGMYAHVKGRMKENEYEIPYRKKCREEDFGRRVLCESMRSQLYVGPQGQVLPCMMMAGSAVEKDFQNLFRIPLTEILHSSQYLQAAGCTVEQYMKHNPKCAACDERNDCCGGCRASAIGDQGRDYLSPDPDACIFFQGGWSRSLEDTVNKALDE